MKPKLKPLDWRRIWKKYDYSISCPLLPNAKRNIQRLVAAERRRVP